MMFIVLTFVLGFLFESIAVTSIGTQCGNIICGKNSNCYGEGSVDEDGSEGLKCACVEGHIGKPIWPMACFRTCQIDSDCPGFQNECIFHDPYFARYVKLNFSIQNFYNYPYSHHHCLYDCSVDEDCGRNAVCQVQNAADSAKDVSSRMKCTCIKNYIGLPYLQCFDPKLVLTAGQSTELYMNERNSAEVRCPKLPKSKGTKTFCLDPDGTEHDCSNGGIPSTSAVFSCETGYVPTSAKIKYYRMKCTSSGKWTQHKIFHCSQHSGQQ